jgi:two-component system, sensor histidine kinase
MTPIRIALKDIRVRAILAGVVPLVVVSLALSAWFTHMRIQELEDSIIDRGQTIVRQLAASSEFGVFTANTEILQRLAERTLNERSVAGVMIQTADGALLAQAGAAIDGDADSATFAFSAPVMLQQSDPADPFLGLFELASNLGTRPIGIVTLSVSKVSLIEGRQRLIAVSLTLTLLGLIGASLLAARMARLLTRPVLSLADTVSRIERGDLTARARIDATGALEVLEIGINDMAAAIANARDELEQRITAATSELHRQKDEAERATRVKTQFLAAASHDLRQPLQALGLAIMSLKLESTSDAHRQSIGRIERALGALEGVLEALLDISQLDAGIVTPRLSQFPIERLFDRLRAQNESLAERHQLMLSIHPSKIWVRSDAALLERVLANLLSNALRYTTQGAVLVGCRWRGATIRIEVRDSGPGIPPDQHDEIFREFVQLESKGRQGEKGLGLGLAIVKRLCRLLAHDVGLKSSPGKGSVFWVDVPRVERGIVPPVSLSTSIARPSLHNRVIVVIDDDHDVREALVDLLDRHGASALAAEGETDARRLIKEIGVPPDLILSDFRLANGVDGVTVIRTLRREFGPDIPAAILTGDVAPDVIKRVKDSGLPMLGKPYAPDRLIERITALVSPLRSG